jgi:hypothetical protein
MGEETYRRRIELRPAAGVVDGAMEDFLHHFAVRLHHDGTVIRGVEVDPARVPWTTCPVGAAGVGALEGVALAEVRDLDRWIGGRASQCVHVVDLAVLAAAAAGRGRPRTYEVWVTQEADDLHSARLLVDGTEWATWRVQHHRLLAEGRFAGLALDRRTFSAWVAAHLDPDEAEMAFVFRRAIAIGNSRFMDMDDFTHPSESMGAPESCHTFRHDVAPVSFRNKGSGRRTEDDGEGTPLGPVQLRPVHRRRAGPEPDPEPLAG